MIEVMMITSYFINAIIKENKWGNVVPFYKNIQSEGIVLWKAA